LLAAAFYTVRLLHGQLHQFSSALSSVSPPRLAIGQLFSFLLLLCPLCYHILAVERVSGIRGERRKIASAYALSQIVRYVPGKVLGVLFELSYLRGTVRADALLVATTAQGIYQYACVAAIAIPLLLAWALGSQWPWLISLVAIVLIYFSHRLGWCERPLLWTTRNMSRAREATTLEPWHAPIAATTFLAAEWIFFIGAWYVLDLGTPYVMPYVLLATCYAAAAALGAIAVFVPSGLVVRESIFLWMAHQLHFDSVTVLAYAAIFRIWLTAGDILVALAFGMFLHFSSDSSRIGTERS